MIEVIVKALSHRPLYDLDRLERGIFELLRDEYLTIAKIGDEWVVKPI